MKKAFTVIGIAFAGIAAFFIIRFITTPNAINIVNSFYDDIVRYAENNRDSHDALINYPFQHYIVSHGAMLSPDMKKRSAFFVTNFTNKTEDGFVYMYNDDTVVATEWANCDLTNGTKSGDTYTFDFGGITIKITPIKDHVYYTHTIWAGQRPTEHGG